MASPVVIVTVSPSISSRSTRIAQAVAIQLESAGLAVRRFSPADFDSNDVFAARAAASSVADFIAAVSAAPALVVASPVYKASYAGILKAIVDLIPPDAIVGRPALGIATARISLHAEEAASAYRSLFRFFRARPIEPLVVRDDEIAGADGVALHPATEMKIAAAARAVAQAVVAG